LQADRKFVATANLHFEINASYWLSQQICDQLATNVEPILGAVSLLIIASYFAARQTFSRPVCKSHIISEQARR